MTLLSIMQNIRWIVAELTRAREASRSAAALRRFALVNSRTGSMPGVAFAFQKSFPKSAGGLGALRNTTATTNNFHALPLTMAAWFPFVLVTLANFPFSTLADGLGDTNEIPQLRPIHAELPPTFWDQYGALVLVGSVVFAALIGLLIWAQTRPQPPVVIPPEVQARQALAALLNAPEDGATLSRITQILRHYVRRAFELPPNEVTTTEFCRLISNHPPIGVALALVLTEFLRDNDVRKFAPGRPAEPAAGTIAQALALIEKCEARRALLSAAPSPASVNPPAQPA